MKELTEGLADNPHPGPGHFTDGAGLGGAFWPLYRYLSPAVILNPDSASFGAGL